MKDIAISLTETQINDLSENGWIDQCENCDFLIYLEDLRHHPLCVNCTYTEIHFGQPMEIAGHGIPVDILEG